MRGSSEGRSPTRSSQSRQHFARNLSASSTWAGASSGSTPHSDISCKVPPTRCTQFKAPARDDVEHGSPFRDSYRMVVAERHAHSGVADTDSLGRRRDGGEKHLGRAHVRVFEQASGARRPRRRRSPSFRRRPLGRCSSRSLAVRSRAFRTRTGLQRSSRTSRRQPYGNRRCRRTATCPRFIACAYR